jgi:cysteine-rich repeat protein
MAWLVTGCGDLDDDASTRDVLAGDRQLAIHNGNHVPALAATCGDGILDAGEECDDGNLADHDGCSAACTFELVAEFLFTGAAGNESTFLADLADPELVFTPELSRGVGLTPTGAADAFSAASWTTNATIDPDDFYSVTVTPLPGATMKLVALQLDERRSSAGIRSWSVRSSLDGFTSDLALFTVPDDLLFRTQTIALPAPFQSLTTGVELRIFGFAAEFPGGTWRIDNVRLIGEIEQPCGNGILDAGEQCDDGGRTSGDGCAAACTLELMTELSFTGAAGNEPTFAAEIADPGLAITPVISRGPGLTASVAENAFSASAWTLDTVIDPVDFYSFTVTPLPGETMRLLALQLDERRSATGIHSWSVRSSLDDFASDIALFTVPDDILFRTQTIPLPAPFQSLTTAVELRIFGFAAEFPGGTWRVDNVRLIGEIERPCGNGILDAGEQCDDGNRTGGDGCSAACTLALVTRFSFPGAVGAELTFAADLTDAALASTPEMSRGAGLTPSVAADAFSASGWTTNTVLDPDDFYSFTVTPSPGATMILVGLELDERRSASGILSWSVRSSLDGFASDVALFTAPFDTLFRTHTVRLPVAFHSLTTPVELRIFGFQALAVGGTWRIDNVRLLGITTE